MANYTKKPWLVGDFGIVCSARGVVAQVSSHSCAEGRANVNLVAAAPDLLEALQGLLSVTGIHGEHADKAGAAIKKATGQ